MYVYKGSEIILRAMKCGTLYCQSDSTIISYATVASSIVHKEVVIKLWHMRLGRVSEKWIQIMLKRDLLCGHKMKDLEVYEYCIFEKFHRSKFSRGVH